MQSLRYKGVLVAWTFLIAATLATGLLADGAVTDRSWVVPLLLLIAAIKARVVVMHYMELRHAPMAWRIAFESWVFLTCAIVGLFWYFGR